MIGGVDRTEHSVRAGFFEQKTQHGREGLKSDSTTLKGGRDRDAHFDLTGVFWPGSETAVANYLPSFSQGNPKLEPLARRKRRDRVCTPKKPPDLFGRSRLPALKAQDSRIFSIREDSISIARLQSPDHQPLCMKMLEHEEAKRLTWNIFSPAGQWRSSGSLGQLSPAPALCQGSAQAEAGSPKRRFRGSDDVTT